jgi:hypothetical protein
MVEVPAAVDIFDRHDAAAAKRAMERGDGFVGRDQVRQQEARVDDVELALARSAGGVGLAKLHVGDAPLSRLLASEVELDRVDVDPEYPPARRDSCRELQGRVATAAADVEDGEPVAELEAVEEGARGRRHDATEDAEPLTALDAASNDVVTVLHDRLLSSSRARSAAAAPSAGFLSFPVCGNARDESAPGEGPRPGAS